MGWGLRLLLIVTFWGCTVQPPGEVFLLTPAEQAAAISQSSAHSHSTETLSDKTLTRWHDFGVQKPSSTLKHEFLIENNTASAWTLAGVKTDCSCTIATPKWKSIPAGERKPVTVELKTGSAIRFQPVSHTVEVSFREPTVTPARFTVNALVRDVLYITPERVVLADVGKGATVTRPIVVSNFGFKSISPPVFKASVPWITSAPPVVESVTDGMPSSPSQRFRYDISLDG